MAVRVGVVARRWDARLLLAWSCLALCWVFPAAASATTGPSFAALSGSLTVARSGAGAAPCPAVTC